MFGWRAKRNPEIQLMSSHPRYRRQLPVGRQSIFRAGSALTLKEIEIKMSIVPE
jgi:hypothetical protein